MQLGWIDFSKEARNKVLSVIDLLSEDGTLDELGIAAVRDGFANVFFPGTSTIQTRAKYFVIVPYVFTELEKRRELNSRAVLEQLDAKERRCGEILTATGADGVVGSRSLKSGTWVKRTPADIYWAGIRRYGIFTGGNFSLSEYVRASCALKAQKNTLQNLGNRKDDAEECERDDADSGGLFTTTFWNLPIFPADWMDGLTIGLSKEEVNFLKDKIISSCSGSMMAYILENNLSDIPQMNSFHDLATGSINQFPDDIRADYWMAKAFSNFIYGARIRYNIMLSQGKNELAKSEWDLFMEDIDLYTDVDIDAIFKRLQIYNPMLRGFLLDIQANMHERDVEALDERIFKRECQLKGVGRAKLSSAGEFPVDAWIGGGALDYRFGNASVIINDIFSGEGATKC